MSKFVKTIFYAPQRVSRCRCACIEAQLEAEISKFSRTMFPIYSIAQHSLLLTNIHSYDYLDVQTHSKPALRITQLRVKREIRDKVSSNYVPFVGTMSTTILSFYVFHSHKAIT